MEILQLNHEMVLSILPERKADTHKGDYGRVLLICGSRGYTGAAALAAMGALRSGAGLVYLGVPDSIYAIEAVKLNEPIIFPLPDDDGKLSASAVAAVRKLLPKMDAVLIGPGLSSSEGVEDILRCVMQYFSGPVVVDADGINALARHMDILRERHHPTILTPHPGEFARLGGDVSQGREAAAISFAKEYGCILCLKGHGTVVTEGQHCYRNPTGNPGMAVGGSGDVLAGIVVSLIGQGIAPLEATACASWIHGAAGDICAERMGQYGLLPSDLLEVLPQLMK